MRPINYLKLKDFDISYIKSWRHQYSPPRHEIGF